MPNHIRNETWEYRKQYAMSPPGSQRRRLICINCVRREADHVRCHIDTCSNRVASVTSTDSSTKLYVLGEPIHLHHARIYFPREIPFPLIKLDATNQTQRPMILQAASTKSNTETNDLTGSIREHVAHESYSLRPLPADRVHGVQC